MRIFLITLLLMFGTQATAKPVTGSKAIVLVERANKVGVMLFSKRERGINFFAFLVDGRYYWCEMGAGHQFCKDMTGYNP